MLTFRRGKKIFSFSSRVILSARSDGPPYSLTTKNKKAKKVVEKQQEVAQGDDDDFYNPDEDNYFRDTSNTDADSDALLNDIMDWVNKN